MIASIGHENMLGYLSLDIICSEKLTSQNRYNVQGQISEHMSPQMEAIIYISPIFKTARVAKQIWRMMKTIAFILGENISPNFQNCTRCEKDLKDNKHDSLHLGRK